jgi:hypothetical protein
MFDKCFRCGQPGHLSRQCPQNAHHPPALDYVPAGHGWKPPPPPANPHKYPDDHWLLHSCPHCGRGPYQQCWNVGTGQERRPHTARTNA